MLARGESAGTGNVHLYSNMLTHFSGGTSGEEPTCQCRRLKDAGSIPGYS